MKFPLKGIFLSTILGTMLFAVPAYSQVTKCDLDLRVVNADDLSNISGASATLIDSKAKTSQTAVAKNGFLHFTGLQQDREYQIVLIRLGFNRTLEEKRTVICAPLFDGAVRSFAYLKKGNPKQIYYPERAGSDHEFRIGSEGNTSVKSGVGIKGGTPVSPAGNSAEKNSQMQIQLGSADTQVPADGERKIPKIVSKGVINGSAIYLSKPDYPETAKAVGASGAVSVQVTIDEEGNVISAVATSGHPLLKAASAAAARESKFKPTLLEGVPVKVSGIIVYNFQ